MKIPSYFMDPPKPPGRWHRPAWFCGLTRHRRGPLVITMAEANDLAVMADGSVSLAFTVAASHYACARCWRTME